MLRKWLSRIGAFFVSIWPAIKIFLKWPVIAVAIATIPVESYISSKFNLTPVVSKFVMFGIFAGLLAISWYVAEVIVLLAAIALTMEFFIFVKAISNRFNKEGEESYGREAC